MKLRSAFAFFGKRRRQPVSGGKKTTSRRAPAAALLLEHLEDRTVPSTLPAAVVTNPVSLGGPSGYNPDVVQDPTNSLKLVEVYTTGALLVANYSTDGGQTWNGLINNGGTNLPNVFDPTLNVNPSTTVKFAAVSSPTVAMDRAHNVYILAAEHNAANTVGELLLQRYDFTFGTPSNVASNILVQRWTNSDPVLNPVVAVDNNVPSFTDTTISPSETQTDTMAGLNPDPNFSGRQVPKALYIAWNTNVQVPSPAPANFNPNVIMAAGSADGGNTWTAPQIVSNNGGYIQAGVHDADPQVVFTQGSADGRVKGGQLAFVWNDFGGNRIQVNTSQPDGGVAGNLAAASYQFAGTTGNITDAGIRLNSATVAVGGNGYKLGDLLTINNDTLGVVVPPSGTASNQATVQVTALGASAVGIAAAGTGYAANDVLTFVGGTGTATTVTVKTVDSAGAITAITLTTAGAYTVLPANPNTVSGGAGTGAKISATFDAVAAVTIVSPGAYLVPPGPNPVDVTGGTGVTGTGAKFTLGFGGTTADLATSTTFTTAVSIPAGFTVNDLSVTLSLVHPQLDHLDIQLVSPTGTIIKLLLNRTDGLGRTVDESGNPIPPSTFPPAGIAGANLGEVDGNLVGTVFDDNGARLITDASLAAPYTATFRPETDKLDVATIAGRPGDSADISGTWSLIVTDHKNDGETKSTAIPVQHVDGWSLNFSHISTTGFGGDNVANGAAPVAGAYSAPYPLTNTASGAAGIGPGLSVAVDNTLGAFSPYQGRLYVAYTGGSGTNTDVYLLAGDNLSSGGASWRGAVKVNDDSSSDNFSEGIRPQFMPTVAVDPVTGTVGVMYYDGRWDPALTRVANSFSASIDGGKTFSPSTFFNTPKTATDEITGKTITIEPVPGNQGNAGANGFGERQGLVMYAGHVIPVFTSNDNSNGTALKSATVTVAAGPRVVFGDMGPITSTFTSPVGFVSYNNTFASDGTRQFNGFVVQFDRPIVVSSFTLGEVTIMYRDTVTPPSQAGVIIPNTDYTISPLDGFAPFGQLLSPTDGYLATTFLIQLNVGKERSGVGTYSYAIGNLTGAPVIHDGLKTTAAPTTGNFMDQNQNARTGETPDSVVSSAAVDINNVGTGYKVNDLLRVPGGTPTVQAILQVTSVGANGEVTGVRIYQPGLYTGVPPSQVFINSATGTGAAFNLTYTGTPGDVFAIPTPTNGPPFQLPYDQNTLPLIIPGPHVVSTSVAFNPAASTTATDNLVLNGTNNAIDVTFDRDMQAGSFTAANILRMIGPAGPITTYTLGPAVSFTGGGGSGAAGIATISGGVVTAVTITNPGSGYTSPPAVVFSGGGGTLAAGTATVSGGAVTGVTVTSGGLGYSTTPAQAIPDGGTLNVPMTIPDSLQINDLTVGLNITHAQVSDLTVMLIAPDGTQVQLFPGGTGANLTNTVFDDNAPALITTGAGPYTGIFRPEQGVTAALITAGGGGYKVNDILTVVGGTSTTAAQLKVTSVDANGAITAVTILNGGAYSVEPYNPVAVTDTTTPAGTGATFTLTYGGLSALNGKNYLGTWTLRITDNVTNGIAGTLNGWSFNPFSVTANPPGGTANRTFRITFPTQTTSGTYSLVFGPDTLDNYIKDSNGNAVDTNLNAGVNLLRGGDPVNGNLVPVAYSSGTVNTAIPAGQTINSVITVPDSFLVEGATVQLSIQHQNDPDLTATLIAPDGLTSVQLFSGVGTSGSSPHANFTNTTFDDAALTPIQQAATQPNTGIGAGPFNPQFPLSTFTNHGALGKWTLRITSTSSTLSGTLVNWSLTLKKSVPGSGLGEQVADQFTASFRLFTQDPTNTVAQNQWTAVGPLPLNSGTSAGRVTSVAVDPSDPSGNTVYAAGQSGGLWKTTNFLTTDANGPVWQPLTDSGPSNSLDISSVAIFARNNDPNQSILFAATGVSADGTTGVGLLRSLDGGKNWRLLDSTANADASGNILPINDPGRNHQFSGTTIYKIIVDPTAEPNGEVIVYMAVSGGSSGAAGIWRSLDTGKTWTLLQAGSATDVVLSAGSAGANGNLQILYGAISAKGVYYTTNAPTTSSMSLQGGGQGNPIRRNVDTLPDSAIPVGNPSFNPGGGGRISLAVPALTGSPLQDTLHEGWVYAIVDGTTGSGLYLTKDFGLNWTEVHLPLTAPNRFLATNDDTTGRDYNVGGAGLTIAVDPNNAAVVYIGGGTANAIRVDTSTLSDAYAEVAYDNSNNDGGLVQTATTGGVSLKNPGSGYGLVDPVTNKVIAPYYNMLRNPNSPFLTPSSLPYTNITSFTNTGYDASWGIFNGGVSGGSAHYSLVVMRDPLTGHTRLIYGDDTGIWTGTDDGTGHVDNGIGAAKEFIGTRNGNLQILELTHGAAQPSTLAADLAGALLYATTSGYGYPQSAAKVLDTGNISWTGPGGSSTTFGSGSGVQTDQTGGGALYQYKWPLAGASPRAVDFFQYTAAGTGAISRTTGLIQTGDDPATGVGQWPLGTGSNFAVNPIDPTGIVMSSQAGRLFLTSGSSLGTGKQWFPIADPSDLDGTYAPAVAFGAPTNATAPLDNFIYAGTSGGKIFVTFTGGGTGTPWKNISAGLDGAAVQQIVTNPTRGSHEAYAITTSGVFFLADSSVASPTWTKITGNLFSTSLTRVLLNDPAQMQATLLRLTSLQADYRYAIPDDLTKTGGPTHPVLYVAGLGGVYRSLDKGSSWTYFPNIATDGALQDGGLLPDANVTALTLSVGNINPANGLPSQPYGRNMLVAFTNGRSAFAIRLNDQIRVPGGNPLFTYAVSPVAGPHVVSMTPSDTSAPLSGITVTFSGPVDPATFTAAKVNSVTGPDGSAIKVASVQDQGATNHNVYKIVFAAPTYTYGFYRVSLGPNISDYSGNKMDQNQNFVNGELPADIYSARVLYQPFANHAPVLGVTTATLPSVNEDQTKAAITGTTVNGFVTGLASPGITDPDNTTVPGYQNGTPATTAPVGIAVTGVDNTNGAWQYSLDNGANWSDFGTPSVTAARLLEANSDGIASSDRIRFVPKPNWNGTATFTFQAWDLTSGLSVYGADGGTADASVNGGSTAFSTATATATITVNFVNDQPSFTASNPPAVNEDTTAPQTVTGWVTAFNPGGAPDANEQGQTVLAYHVTVLTGASLFAAAPTVDNSGNLHYTLNPNVSGAATFSVTVQDNGGTANGGVDTSAPQTFTLTVNFVNDQPSFTASNPPAASEDGGAQTVTGWVKSFNPGGAPDANESGQKVKAYIVSNVSNPALFSVQPAVDTSGNLTYTLAPNASGSSTFDVKVQDDGGTANGGVDTSAAQTFTLTVNFVNDQPSFTASNPPAANEDTGAHTVTGWATFNPGGAPDANESGQKVKAYTVSNVSNPSLFTVQPAVDTSGNLTYTLAPNASGSSTFQVQVQDDGGTANGGVDTSAPQTFTLTVNLVNDQPSFTAANPPAANEDSGAHTVTGWVTAFNPGGAPDANESGQKVKAYLVSNVSNPTLFTVQPAVDTSGNLTYTLAPNASGSSTFAVQVQDDGGTANGGVDTSAAQTFTLTVNFVNDQPSFTASNPPAANEDTGAHTVTGWATFNPGGAPDANESGQKVKAYNVSNVSNPSLFAVQPAVDTSGNLTYTLAPNASGSSTFAVQVQDDGGTANGGVDTSAAQTFTLTVNFVNDQPSFTASNPPAANEDSGAQSVAGWVKSFNPGGAPDANESGQKVKAYIVSNVSNPGLFAVQPAVDTSGNLTYTLAPNASGSSTFAVQVQDDGGTANGGVDTSAAQTFTLTVNLVNDQPTFTATNPPVVNEDSGAQTVSGWVKSFNPGGAPDANEQGQKVKAYNVSNVSNPSLFAVQPAVDSSGNLTYTLAPNVSGTSTFQVQVQDDGGTANGGIDTSAPQTFAVSVSFVNDVPSFTAGPNEYVLKNSGTKTVSPWATNISPGPGANEAAQAVSFLVSNNNPGLFAAAPAIDPSGNLTFTPAANAVGQATVSVRLQDNGGTANGGQDTSAVQTFIITVETTAVAVSASPTSAAYGQTVTFTATLSDSAGGTVNGGTVSFYDGDAATGTPLGSQTVSGGTASIQTNALPVGASHTITAVYSGTPTFQGGAGTLSGYAVNPDHTSTAVSAAPPAAVYGQTVTLTATLSNADSSVTVNGGTVSFYDGSAATGTFLGSNSVSGGTASIQTNALPVGASHTITAVYSGTTDFSGSTGTLTGYAVSSAHSSTTVSAKPASSAYGQTVTFTATLTDTDSPGATVNGGTVSFYDGSAATGTPLGSGPVANNTASIQTAALPAGSNHTITAVYSGTSNLGTSTGTLNGFVVSPAHTDTALAAAPNPVVYGQPVTFTATVTSPTVKSADLAGTTVTFVVDGTSQPAAPVDASGQAKLTLSSLGLGDHTITATYNGNGNLGGSGPAALTETVIGGSATAVASSANPSEFGQPVTFTATVSNTTPSNGPLTGTVTFVVDGASQQPPVALDANHQATLTLSNLNAGPHTVSAVYSGTNANAGSTSAPLTETVSRAVTTLTLTVPTTQTAAGQPVTFTAAVTSKDPNAAPDGTVTFLVDGVPQATVALDATGQASYTTTTISAGTHAVSATYSGSANFSPSASQGTVTLAVAPYLGSPDEVWINQVYHDIFNRPADPAGLTYWEDQLEAGVPRATVASEFVNSDEYRRDYIGMLFRDLLHRVATTDEVNYHLGYLAYGETYEQLTANFLGSAEYMQAGGRADPATYVNDVFRYVLGHAATPDALNYYVGVLQSSSGHDMALAVLLTPEAQGRFVRTQYEKLLRREPDGSPNFWYQAVVQGTRDEAVIAALISSDEYFMRGAPYHNTQAQEQTWINQVYVGLLGRSVDGPGLAYWTNALEHGLPRLNVTEQIVNSGEYRARMIGNLFHTLLNRPPSSNELATYQNNLMQGQTVEQLKALIIGSQEYASVRGGGTAYGFLSAIYHDVLQRTLDSAGTQYWGSKLASEDHTTLALEMLHTLDADEVLVQNDYLAFLHRSADPAGAAYWAGQLQAGFRDEYVLAELAATKEYYNRFKQS